MLKTKTKILVIFLIIVLLFSTIVLADNEASENEIMPISGENYESQITSGDESDNTVSQPSNDSHKKNDVYILEDNVTIDYNVDGNVFVCADTVTLNSQIGGDAFICAKTLIVDEKAYIFNNLFAVAESIEVKGISYDVYASAKTFTISNGHIYRDIKLVADTFNVNGVVGRDASITVNNINFNTTENSNGVIHGNLDYYSDSELSIPENFVNGKINHHVLKGSSIVDYVISLIAFVVFVIALWLICLWIAPKFLNNTNNYLCLKSIGIGLLAFIAIPVVCLALLLLILTAGVSLFLLTIYILSLIASKALFTIMANNYICTKLNINKNIAKFGMLILSSLVIWAITQIPYVGFPISIIITIFGLGVLVSSILCKSKSE